MKWQSMCCGQEKNEKCLIMRIVVSLWIFFKMSKWIILTRRWWWQRKNRLWYAFKQCVTKQTGHFFFTSMLFVKFPQSFSVTLFHCSAGVFRKFMIIWSANFFPPWLSSSRRRKKLLIIIIVCRRSSYSIVAARKMLKWMMKIKKISWLHK